MNCSNCGAAFDVAPFSDIAECAYCGTMTSLRSAERGLDRIVWSEDLSGTDCPRCGEDLVRASLDGNRAEACPHCRGVMLANQVFGSLVRERRATYRGTDNLSHPVDLDQLSDPIYCPSCHRTMEVHPYYGPGHQVIDSCSRCALVWVDSGELTAIERAPGIR